MQSTGSLEVQWENLNESINPSNLQCGHHNLATKVCLNSNCSAYVFLCRDKSCQCFKFHKGCIKGSIQSIKQAIQQKLMSVEPFVKRIDKLIQNAINSLSDYAQKIIDQTQKELNYIGLTQNERKFLKALNTKNADQLTGKDMHEILSSIDNVTGFNEKMQKVENKVNSCWDTFNLSMKSLFTKVQRHLQVFTGNTKLHFSESLIIKTQTQKQRIVKFFGKSILIPQLLYRASENDFKVTNFFEKTKNTNHTLIICQTEFGKIIGGYNHTYWKTDQNDFRWGDQTKKSFVFSLTNNDKFSLRQSSPAFKYSSGYGPIFGNNNGWDFFISNRAHLQNKSGSNINNAFWNVKYTKGSMQSIEMFSGNKQSGNFFVKEWQVWQINFVDPQDQ